jgi:hypothetical protein
VEIIVIILLCFIGFKTVNINITSPLFLFSLFVILLYFIPYLTLWGEFKRLNLVSNEYLFSFFAIVSLCYAAFILGDGLAGNKFKMPKKGFGHYSLAVNVLYFEKYAIICGLIGLAGYGSFVLFTGIPRYLKGHGSGDFSIGGYVYELRYFIFSSITLLFYLFLNKKITRKGRIYLLLFSILLALDAVIQQQRGSWIRFGIIFLLLFMFQKLDGAKKGIKLKDLFSKYRGIILSGLFLGLLLVFTVQVRKFAKKGSSLTDQLSTTAAYIYDNPSIIFGGSGVDEGNEFVTAINAYQAATVSNEFDYGYKWLYGFINFYPRALWAGKPELVDFSVNEFDLIDKYSVIQHAPGSAKTGIIDAYFRFSWLAPIFFIIVGYYFRILYNLSIYDIRYRFFYICLYIGFFYFITQDMFPLVIFTIYMYVPIQIIVNKTVRKIT